VLALWWLLLDVKTFFLKINFGLEKAGAEDFGSFEFELHS
jgi:hypothetical protein